MNQKQSEELTTALQTSEPRCLRCRFAVANPGDMTGGGCHRNPPGFIPIPNGRGGIAVMNAWPPIKLTTDWCGYFEEAPKIQVASKFPEPSTA